MDAFIEANLPLCIDNKVSEKPLTFGVEIEIAIATLGDDWHDPHPEDGRKVRGLLASDFNELSFDPQKGGCRQFYRNTWRGVAKELEEKGIKLQHTQPKVPVEDCNSWAICMDRSICAPKALADRYGYLWIPAEIVSPAFEYSEAALTEVKIVVETLASKFRISCNRSCGIHIHVGNGPDGFVHETIRNLFATLWTFEPQIMTIHPAHRLTNEENCTCYRTGTCCGYERTKYWYKSFDPLQPSVEVPLILNPANERPNAARGLEDLLATENIAEIKALNTTHDRRLSANCGYKMAYHCGNVTNEPLPDEDIDPDAYMWKPTIEFRQHRSTLAGAHIDAWIRFCVQLVQFAQVVPRAQLDPFLRAHVLNTPETFTLPQVLMRLGMVGLAFRYPDLIRERIADEEATEGRVEKEELVLCMDELWKIWEQLKEAREEGR